MAKITLAKLIQFEQLPVWECQLCKGEEARRTKYAKSMMIHLVQVHLVQLSLQSFPPGELQEGSIFHVGPEKNSDNIYKGLYTSPLTLPPKRS